MSYTPEEKERLLLKALANERGRAMIASSMANPIRMSLDYQGVGRKLIVVDPLPQGALPVYDKDIQIPATVISKRGQVPDRILEGERITVPTLEIASYPQVRFSQIKERRFNLIDRAQQKAKADLQAGEDEVIFTAVNAASTTALSGVNDPVVQTGTTSPLMSRTLLTAAFQEVEKWDLIATKILMHARAFADLRDWGSDQFDPVTRREVLLTGIFGHLWTADILVSKVCPPDRVYILAEPEFVGVMPVRQEVNVIPADKPEKLRLGWVVYEEIGVAIVNPRGVAQAQF